MRVPPKRHTFPHNYFRAFNRRVYRQIRNNSAENRTIKTSQGEKEVGVGRVRSHLHFSLVW